MCSKVLRRVWLILTLNFGVHSKLRNKLCFSENQEKTSLKLEIRKTKKQTNKPKEKKNNYMKGE